jgi:hypothetical protein
LKQSPREINELLRDLLISNGWTQLQSEPCIYIYRHDGIFAMLGIYVDDLPLACNNTQWVVEIKRTLGQRFKIKDLSELNKLLGMHITRDRVARTISIDETYYLTDVLDKHSLSD